LLLQLLQLQVSLQQGLHDVILHLPLFLCWGFSIIWDFETKAKFDNIYFSSLGKEEGPAKVDPSGSV
jgi:hypothetical protein